MVSFLKTHVANVPFLEVWIWADQNNKSHLVKSCQIYIIMGFLLEISFQVGTQIAVGEE